VSRSVPVSFGHPLLGHLFYDLSSYLISPVVLKCSSHYCCIHRHLLSSYICKHILCYVAGLARRYLFSCSIQASNLKTKRWNKGSGLLSLDYIMSVGGSTIVAQHFGQFL